MQKKIHVLSEFEKVQFLANPGTFLMIDYQINFQLLQILSSITKYFKVKYTVDYGKVMI